jgi:acyl carrier protein
MNSLDTVEALMAFEEVFAVELRFTNLETSAVRKRWWTGLNFTFQTDG